MRPSPETDLAVRDLVGRYSEAVFDFDTGRFAECWAVDAVWEVPGVVTTEGRDAIVELFARLRGGLSLCVQEVLSGVVHPGEQAGIAHARWQIRELQWRESGQVTCVIGTYSDRVRCDEQGRWCFDRRVFEPRYRGPLDGSGRLLGPSGS